MSADRHSLRAVTPDALPGGDVCAMTRQRLVGPLPVAYALLSCFFLAERLLRQGPEAASLEAGQTDQGTTRAIGRAFGQSIMALAVAPLLNRWRLGRLAAPRMAWSGVAAMVAGLTVRVWAARVLGGFYTRTLRISTTQPLVEDGPYRLVRHPGYLGVLLLLLGAGLASANVLVAGLIAISMGRAYRRRIRSEEVMLTETFGEDYVDYTRRTWRLIPWVY
jgi:protein-S-isoprenylcysteine O-methyltransferase Ste14